MRVTVIGVEVASVADRRRIGHDTAAREIGLWSTIRRQVSPDGVEREKAIFALLSPLFGDCYGGHSHSWGSIHRRIAGISHHVGEIERYAFGDCHAVAGVSTGGRTLPNYRPPPS